MRLSLGERPVFDPGVGDQGAGRGDPRIGFEPDGFFVELTGRHVAPMFATVIPWALRSKPLMRRLRGDGSQEE